MKMRYVKYLVFVLLLNCGMSYAISSPVTVLQGVSNRMISQLKVKKLQLKHNPKAVFGLVHRYFLPYVDMNLVSRAVLGQYWQKFSASQRKTFQRRFTNIVIGTYASALAAYTNERVQFLPLRTGFANRKTVRIDSRIIRQQGPAIPVSYRMIRRGNSWKVYDLIVEGVSLVQSYRAQFRSIVGQQGVKGLLTAMAKHNAKR